jgi:serine/threonine-protein kinase ULK/ATG1
MHRDFKLANIFLHQDSIIIGDFGFAKSGVDMATTKLGSPITMAPELLTAGSIVRYTNKADLWSIGVCFFQMIFGKPPWNAKNLKDLKQKVQTQSGENLRIPSEPKTSDPCKELLISLIEPDVDKRIEWSDFFNHKLFHKHRTEEKPLDMRSSVMFRNNEDRVAELFSKNQKSKQHKVDLVDPLEIKLEIKKEENSVAGKKEAELEKEREKAINQARQRYTHEKKIIVFIMHTCRKLRNLAKQRQHLKQASESLMYSGLLLLKKGIIKNEIAVNTITHQVNSFQLPEFEHFLETNNCRKILKELSKDNKLYYTLLSHLQKKMQAEIGLSNPRAKELYDLSVSNTTSLSDIQPELAKEARFLIQFHAQRAHTLAKEIKREFSIGLCDLFLSVESEDKFEFMSKDLIPFDWHEFERNFNMNFVNKTLQEALEN